MTLFLGLFILILPPLENAAGGETTYPPLLLARFCATDPLWIILSTEETVCLLVVRLCIGRYRTSWWKITKESKLTCGFHFFFPYEKNTEATTFVYVQFFELKCARTLTQFICYWCYYFFFLRVNWTGCGRRTCSNTMTNEMLALNTHRALRLHRNWHRVAAVPTFRRLINDWFDRPPARPVSGDERRNHVNITHTGSNLSGFLNAH